MSDSLYCLKCTYHRGKIITNKSNFCNLGYTQNPISLESTLNALQNNAEICRFNPWRGVTRQKAEGDTITWVKSLLRASAGQFS